MIWKFLFVIYVFVLTSLYVFGLYQVPDVNSVPFIEAVSDYCIEGIIVLTLIYTFALGWKKRLINEYFHKIFWIFSLISFVLSAIITYKNTYTPMHSDMLLQAMQNGMVPRHWDFQLLRAITHIEVLIIVAVILFLIFAPFFLGYYHYSKQMNVLSIAKHTGRKCFAIYTVFSMGLIFLSVILGISGDFINFNIFDCLSLLSSAYLAFGVIGYAFNIEILNQAFWRVGLPIALVIELLPSSFYTQDFLNCVGYAQLHSSPVYFVASYLLWAIALVMIYRYATTDVVFKTVSEDEQKIELNNAIDE